MITVLDEMALREMPNIHNSGDATNIGEHRIHCWLFSNGYSDREWLKKGTKFDIFLHNQDMGEGKSDRISVTCSGKTISVVDYGNNEGSMKVTNKETDDLREFSALLKNLR